jgi:hypothetical protein
MVTATMRLVKWRVIVPCLPIIIEWWRDWLDEVSKASRSDAHLIESLALAWRPTPSNLSVPLQLGISFAGSRDIACVLVATITVSARGASEGGLDAATVDSSRMHVFAGYCLSPPEASSASLPFDAMAATLLLNVLPILLWRQRRFLEGLDRGRHGHIWRTNSIASCDLALIGR